MAAEAGNRGNDRRGSGREFSETRDKKALYLAEWVEQERMRCFLGIKERAGPCEVTELLEAEDSERGPPRTRRRIRGESEEEDIQTGGHRRGRAERTQSHSCDSTKQWEAEGSTAHPSTARPWAWRCATSKGERGSLTQQNQAERGRGSSHCILDLCPDVHPM